MAIGLFIQSRLGDSYMNRRVNQLRSTLSECYIAGFARRGRDYPTTMEGIKLATVDDGSYLRRLFALGRAIIKCRALAANADVIYAFQLDALLLGYVSTILSRKRRRLIYEFSDVRQIMVGRSVASKLARQVERMILKRCACVVTTSQGFVDGYFQKWYGDLQLSYVTIEHKPLLPRALREGLEYAPQDGNRIVIGYIGVIRCKQSVRILLEAARTLKHVLVIHIYGVFQYPEDEVKVREAEQKGAAISYKGPYRSPEGLLDVYTKVDIVWDAYVEGENAKWQRTTRFSESCFFLRPLIYSPATQDGIIAKKNGLGYAIDIHNIEAVLKSLKSMNREDLQTFSDNIKALPESFVYYGEELETVKKVMLGEI